jgi:hypothetical protein
MPRKHCWHPVHDHIRANVFDRRRRRFSDSFEEDATANCLRTDRLHPHVPVEKLGGKNRDLRNGLDGGRSARPSSRLACALCDLALLIALPRISQGSGKREEGGPPRLFLALSARDLPDRRFARGWTLLGINSRTLVVLCTQADQRGTHRGVDDPVTAQASSERSVKDRSAAIMTP